MTKSGAVALLSRQFGVYKGEMMATIWYEESDFDSVIATCDSTLCVTDVVEALLREFPEAIRFILVR